MRRPAVEQATVTTVTYTIDRVYNVGVAAHPQEVTIAMGDDVTFKVSAGMITCSLGIF